MREFHKRENNGRLTLWEYLYLCYFYNHLKSLGVYESFIEQGKRWSNEKIYAYIKKYVIAQRNLYVMVHLVDRCLWWAKTREGYDFWRDIDAKIAPFSPKEQRWW